MGEFDKFLAPACTSTTLDIFGPRRGILDAVTSQLPKFHGRLLDVGCGRMPYQSLFLAAPSRVDKYIGLDIGLTQYGRPHVRWDGKTIPFAPGSMDCAIATEVFEHCPEPLMTLREIARVLKSGGLLFFTVPFVWPLHDSPYDEYRYTPFALERLLRTSDFEQIDLQATGGWDATLAQMIGLWVRRRPMSPRMRRVLSVAATPIVRSLFARDDRPRVWKDQVMMTGIFGTAVKAASPTHANDL